jgi:hypothetical protein
MTVAFLEGVNLQDGATEQDSTVLSLGVWTDMSNVTDIVRTTSFETGSDRRWKEDITPLDDGLNRVTQLRGVNFRWKDPAKGDGPQIGLIAQEVEAVFPELVSTDSDGYKSVSYDTLVAPLIEAVKALKAENAHLREETEALQAENAQMKAEFERRLDALEAAIGPKN